MLGFFLAISVVRTDADKAIELSKQGWTFVLAAPSDQFEFPKLVRSFVKAAHMSNIKANFLIVDTYENPVDPHALNVTQFPVLLFINNGVAMGAQYRGFDIELMSAFMNTYAISEIGRISTQKDLDDFYRSSILGLLISKNGATEYDYPMVSEFYRNHHNEISISFVDEGILEPGFYVYRYMDSHLEKLEDLSGKNAEEIGMTLAERSVPEVLKLNGQVASYFEAHNQTFAVLMLQMDGFYLEQDQIEMALKIQEELKMNVTYADLENSQILSYNYGLPDSLDSTMAIIDVSSGRVMKYMIPDALTVENAIKFGKEFREGKAKPFWKSESYQVKQSTVPAKVSADSLTELIADKRKIALAVYYSSSSDIEAFANVTKKLSESGSNDVYYGQFCLARNDWPAEYLEFEELPAIVTFIGGKVRKNEKLGDTEEQVMHQIVDAVDREL